MLSLVNGLLTDWQSTPGSINARARTIHRSSSAIARRICGLANVVMAGTVPCSSDEFLARRESQLEWERCRHRYRLWSHRFDREALTLRRLGALEFIWVTLRQPTAAVVPPSAIGELTQYAWYFPYANARLRRLAALRSDLVLADWEALSHRRGLTYDTIHLNTTGAALMAETITRAIAREAARQRTTLTGAGRYGNRRRFEVVSSATGADRWAQAWRR